MRIKNVITLGLMMAALAQVNLPAQTSGKQLASLENITILQTGDLLMAATDMEYKGKEELCNLLMDEMYSLSSHYPSANKLQFTVHVSGATNADSDEHKVTISTTLGLVRKCTDPSEYRKSDDRKLVMAAIVASGLP